MSGLKAPYQLCLDRTNWKLGQHDINYLVLSVTTDKKRFPVFRDVLGPGSSNHKQCLELIDRWLSCFGADSIGVLLADREFVGNQWLSGLVERKIPFIIRMKEGTYAELEDGRCATLYSLTRKPTPRDQLKSIRARLLKMEKTVQGFPLVFAAKRRKEGQLIVVATHGIVPQKALKIYRQRWRIECQFADWKRLALCLRLVAEHLVSASTGPERLAFEQVFLRLEKELQQFDSQNAITERAHPVLKHQA